VSKVDERRRKRGTKVKRRKNTMKALCSGMSRKPWNEKMNGEERVRPKKWQYQWHWPLKTQPYSASKIPKYLPKLPHVLEITSEKFHKRIPFTWALITDLKTVASAISFSRTAAVQQLFTPMNHELLQL